MKKVKMKRVASPTMVIMIMSCSKHIVLNFALSFVSIDLFTKTQLKQMILC